MNTTNRTVVTNNYNRYWRPSRQWRLLTLGVIGLASCELSPASLGITGPGVPATQANEMEDSQIPAPGIPNSSGGGYRNNIGPPHRYFDYN